jgi:DNA repair exonuclease SbcCD ATPase subunit
MRIDRLKLDHFKSYTHCDLNLAQVTVCSIVGENGTGKSTLIEAIIWALFGYCRHPSPRELVNPASDKTTVEVWFTVDDHEYHVSRTYDDGSMSAAAEMDGQAMSAYASGISPAMTQALNISRELVAESVVVQQGQLSSFIAATPSQRRDLIMSFLGLDRYSKAWAIAKESLKTATGLVESHDRTVAHITAELAKLPLMDAIDACIKACTSETAFIGQQVTELVTKREKMLAENKASLNQINEYSQQVNDLKTKLVQANSKSQAELAKLRKALQDADTQVGQEAQLTESVSALNMEFKMAQDILNTCMRIQSDITNSEQQTNAQRDKIKVAATTTDVCPLCGNHLTPERRQEMMNNMQSELQSLTQRGVELRQQLEQTRPIRSPQSIAADSDLAKGTLAKIEIMKQNRDGLVSQIDKMTTEHAQMTSEIEGQLAHLTQQITGLQAGISADLDLTEQELEEVKKKHANATGKLSEWSGMKQAREALDRSLTDATNNLQLAKDKLPEIDFSTTALSPNGIPLMLANHYLPLIEVKAQEILHQMSDGQLHIQLQVADGKKVELLAGPSHQMRAVRSLSGGEQTRVSLALRLALSQVLFDMTGCKFDCLFIDEPEYLDETGIAQFIGAISNLRPLFPQMFVISHIPTLKGAFNQYVEVRKSGNMSMAEAHIVTV